VAFAGQIAALTDMFKLIIFGFNITLPVDIDVIEPKFPQSCGATMVCNGQHYFQDR
jgi:hypothetical protein